MREKQPSFDNRVRAGSLVLGTGSSDTRPVEQLGPDRVGEARNEYEPGLVPIHSWTPEHVWHLPDDQQVLRTELSFRLIRIVPAYAAKRLRRGLAKADTDARSSATAGALQRNCRFSADVDPPSANGTT
jgi:hypothetical protein